jgi:predicted S18 family serine protease
MIDQGRENSTRSYRERARRRVLGLGGIAACLIVAISSPALARSFQDEVQLRKQIIPILGTTFDRDRKPIGVVAQLQVSVASRKDHNGMEVTFESNPGRFSIRAQVAVVTAINRAARLAGLNTDSWSVSLTVPYEGVTIYGESLSAMVGLTVVALAKGDFVQPARVLTGTVTRDGHIGAVGGISLKLAAARDQNLRRVLVPEEYDVADGDWETPFLLQVSPVGTVTTAYEALTDRPLQVETSSDSPLSED